MSRDADPQASLNPDIARRQFLRTGVAATAVAAAVGVPATRGGFAASPAQDEPAAPARTGPLPTRKLGKTGVDVSILNMGTWRNPAMDRLVRFAFARGVRYYDTAKSYGSEPDLARWFKAVPEARKDIFLVTKDTPREPKDLIAQLDQRLEALQTDYVDLFFVHALGDRSVQNGLEWPKSKEFKEVCEKIRASGKAKFVGFSTHHEKRGEIIQAAADGGFVDVIMLQYSPFLEKDSTLNKALDACYEKGIGLISMKQIAGNSGDAVHREVNARMPELKERGLTPYQALLHAIWTDERIASVCVSMRNTTQITENSEAARNFEPMRKADLDRLREAIVAARPTMCADCDGRCAEAGGTRAKLGDLTRLLTYHDHHGYRGVARELYAEMTEEARDWRGANLAAATEACPRKLDFAKLLPKVDRHLA